jgi:hypothetical protein
MPTFETEKYATYKEQSITLLQKILIPKAKPDSGPTDGPTTGPIGGPTGPTDGPTLIPSVGPSESATDTGASSTILTADGNASNFEDLIIFLFKSKIPDNIKSRLNDVYKIFNPKSPGFIKRQETTSAEPSAPPSGPSAPSDPSKLSKPDALAKTIDFFKKEYENALKKLNDPTLIGKEIFTEGHSVQNILKDYESACMMTINGTRKTAIGVPEFYQENPEIKGAKHETTIALTATDIYNEPEKQLCIKYLDQWKTVVEKYLYPSA